MSEPYSVPSSQKGFEKSNQNDTKMTVKNADQNIVQTTAPQTDSSEYHTFPCSRSGCPHKPPLRFQNYVNPDDVAEFLLSEDIEDNLTFNEAMSSPEKAEWQRAIEKELLVPVISRQRNSI